MPSPMRRSARGAQPPSHSKHLNSTTASSPSPHSSSRNDRKPNTHQKSTTPHSLSSEEASEPPRRSQRSHPSKDDALDDIDPDDLAVADEDEEEVTRCVCGHQDYPGPPLSEAFDGVHSLSEDTGGLFIQCDGCSVWQHGGCVGIIEESQSPDKYYCEECRPKQHELHTDDKGQKYSLYLPLHPRAARKGSFSKGDDRTKRERETTASRASADPVTGRRRATTRSKEHDEEEEAFQRALEESKREAEGSGTGRRGGKRVRDETDDVKQEFKRQRTLSDSRPSVTRTSGSLNDDSEDEGKGESTGRSKKARAEAAQSARQVEVREKEDEREKARLEAAGRRQERAGRRRGDELDVSDDTPNASKQSPEPSSQPGSPQPTTETKRPFPRKGGKKAKKLGNNQYTKNRDMTNQLVASPQSKKRLLGTNQEASSGDEQVTTNGESSKGAARNSPSGQEVVQTNGKPGGRFGRGKYKNGNGAAKQPEEPVERTYTNMKHSLTAMIMFVQRQQPDSANGDRTPPSADSLLRGGPVQLPDDKLETDQDARPYAELSSFQMAEVFARNVESWNQRFGHLA